MAERKVSVELVAKMQGFVAGIESGVRAVKGFGGELEQLGKNNKEHFNRIALGAGVMGAGLVGAFGLIVHAGMEFDKQMSAVGSVLNSTSGEIEQLRAAAMQAGKDTSYSATQAAQAEENLAKAGLTSSAILGGALIGSLSLAAAGGLDLAESADIAAKSMNTFGLEGKDVGHIADVLAAAANKSATDVHEVGEALRMGGLAAHTAGLSLEDTVGTLAAFADKALIGSDAGTSLKTMLAFLAKPTGTAAAEMERLGIKTYDAGGNFIGVAKLAGVLKSSLGDLTQQQRQAALQTIFGSDATRAATVLYDIGENGIRGYIDAVNDKGAAEAAAAQKTDNLAGDIERLKGTIETLAISSSSGASGGLRRLVQAVDDLLSAFLSLPSWIQSTSTVLIGLAGAGLVTAAGLVKVKQTVSEFMEALSGMGPTGAKAADGLGKIGGVAARLGAAGLAIGVIFTGLQLFTNWVEKKHAPVKADIDKLTTSMLEFAGTGKAVGELASKYGENLERISKDIYGLTQAFADLEQTRKDVAAGLTSSDATMNWDPVDPQSLQRIKDLDEALSKMASSGNATQAKLFLDQLTASGTLTEAAYDRLIGMLPKYADATKGAKTANAGLSSGFADAQTKAVILAGTLEGAADAGQKLTDVWKELNGALLGLDKAELAVIDKVDAIKKSFKENGNSVDGNTEAALKNRIAIGEMAQASAEAAQAKYQESGSVAEASKVYDDHIKQLRGVLQAAGLLPAQIDAIIGHYATMPASVTTVVKVRDEALGPITELQRRINELPGYREIHIHTILTRAEKNDYNNPQRWGGITTHAATGALRDAAVFPGGPTRYAFAEPETGGEAFIPRKGNYGRSMDILNRAAAWYGAHVLPHGEGHRSSGPVTLNLPAINIYGAGDPAAVAREVSSQIEGLARRANLLQRTA